VATLQTHALLLRAVDTGESDRIVRLLVPETGRLTAVAKGARRSVRRFAGTLDLFNHLRVHVERRGRGLARLEQATLVRPFAPLRRDPRRFALGCYLLELLDRMAPEGAARADARRLFGFALAALGVVSERPPDARLRILLELRALEALGLRPELRCCVRCGAEVPARAGGVRFVLAEGGPVCERCTRPEESSLRLGLATLRALEQGLRLPLDGLHRLALAPAALAEARAVVGRFQRFHLGVELKSERFLDDMLARAPAAA
jgi:DNA repair protein RecO (recombination protein O)